MTGEPSTRWESDWWTLAAVAAVTAVGAALRLYRLGFDDYWIDETISVFIADGFSMVAIFVRVPFVDRHPGLFYAILKVWIAAFGEAEAVTRLLPAIFGIAAIPAMYLLGKRLFGVEAGLIAAALLTVSQFHVFHSQNLRMYSIFVLLTLVSTYLLLDLRLEHSRRNVAAYVVSAIALGNTHFFGVLVLAAHLCYVLAAEYVVDVRTATGPSRFLTYQFVVGAGIAPGVAGLVGQLLMMAGGANRALGWIDPPTADWPLEALGTAIRRDAPFLGFGLLLFVLAAAVGTYWWRRDGVSLRRLGDRVVGDERTYLLAGLVAFPVLVPFGVSLLFRPLTVVRYTLTASVGVFLAVAGTVRLVSPRSIRYGFVAVLLVTMVAGLPVYYTEEPSTEWSNAAATILEREGDDPFVVNSHPFTAIFRYYLNRKGNADLSEQRTWDPSVIRAARSAGRPVWVVWKPDGRRAFGHGLEAETNYTATVSEQYVGVGVTKYELANATG